MFNKLLYMSLKRKFKLPHTDFIESNDYNNVIFVSKKIKIEPTTTFYDIPIELYRNIIFTDILLLNKLLQVSKIVKNVVYNNRAFMMYHIMKMYNNKKSRLLHMCFKKGYTEVIKLMYFKKNSKNPNGVNCEIEIQNKEYLKQCLVNGRIGTCLLFKNHHISKTFRFHTMTEYIFKSMYSLNFKSLKTFYQNGYHLHESDFPYALYNFKCHKFINSSFFSKLKKNKEFKIQNNWELYFSITTGNLELFKWYTFFIINNFF
jgi:hypothetical protein